MESHNTKQTVIAVTLLNVHKPQFKVRNTQHRDYKC